MTITLRQESDLGATTKGSALTYAELDNNFIDLIAKLSDVADDTTPQLGGNLDVNGNSIVSTSDGNITLTPDGTGDVVLGSFTFDADQTVGAGEDNHVLTYDNATGKISLEAAASGGLSNVSEDTTPQLGGDLDVNGNDIVSTSNANIDIIPDGTGDVTLQADTIQVGDSNADVTITTNGTGDLTLNTNSGTNSGSIVIEDAANGDIALTPNGTGQVQTTNLRYDEDIHALSYAATITPDVANGNVQTITLTGNLTFNAFSNAVAGQSLTLIIDTNGTDRTLTTTMKTPDGTDPTMSTTDTTDICTVFYDGTNYYMNYVTNFS